MNTTHSPAVVAAVADAVGFLQGTWGLFDDLDTTATDRREELRLCQLQAKTFDGTYLGGKLLGTDATIPRVVVGSDLDQMAADAARAAQALVEQVSPFASTEVVEFVANFSNFAEAVTRHVRRG